MADYTSINQLSKRFGVTHRTVSLWLRRKDFPVQRESPWSEDDAVEIEAWRRANLQPNRADPQYQGRVNTEPPADEQTKDYWLMRKYRAQALEAEGKLMAYDKVWEAWVQTLNEMRQRLLLVPSAGAGRAEGKDAAGIELVYDECIRSAIDDIADRMGDLSSDAEDPGGGGEGIPDPTAVEAE